MSSENLRSLNYRAVIPFYILWDTDLNANHLRLYGQIEQLESNPNPKVKASFSYQWLADCLGIARRNAIETAKKLIEKGYVQHIQNDKGFWIWRTTKAQLIEDDTDCSISTSDAERHPPVMPSITPPVMPSITLNTIKLNTSKLKDIKKEKTCEIVENEGIARPISSPVVKGHITPFELHQQNQPKQIHTNYFEMFWNLYPVKKAVTRARTAWFSQNCDAIAETIIQRLQHQIKKDAQFLDGYAPNPDKYVLEERWNDEIQIRKTAKSKHDPLADYDRHATGWGDNLHEDLF